MSAQKWTRSSLSHLSQELAQVGHPLSPPTVGRLLEAQEYSAKVNAKKQEGSDHPDRNIQFEHIEAQRRKFGAAGLPIISVDGKKKELIGEFKNHGRTWCKDPRRVNVHDFPSDALGRAVPFGVYDLARNLGLVGVGMSADTAEFAVDVIVFWWVMLGMQDYPDAKRLLIYADCGGSNSYRTYLWKHELQTKLCDPFGLTVTVCHYPRGCSKWNPIEHRLFGPISVAWAGEPLTSWDGIVGRIAKTETKGGLKVNAYLNTRIYETGRKVSKEDRSTLNIEPADICPLWNYTIRPHAPHVSLDPVREVIS
jgi:hypothetical protein